MATTTPNFGWDIPQSTDLVKDGATAIAALGTDIDTALVDLKGGTTGQVLSKASNTDLDFTWVAQDDSNAIQNAILDAKGDLITATANDTPARLGVGTNGQFLTADSTQATGLAWTTVSTGSLTLISEQTLSGASSVTFGSIPGTYKRLLLIWSGLYLTTGSTGWVLRFNNDSGASVYRYNSQTASGGNVNAVTSNFSSCGNNAFAENNTSTSLENTAVGNLLIDNYASTTRFKNYTFNNGFRRTATSDNFLERTEGTYTSTSAITSLDIVRTFGTGNMTNLSSTSIRLYGIN